MKIDERLASALCSLLFSADGDSETEPIIWCLENWSRFTGSAA